MLTAGSRPVLSVPAKATSKPRPAESRPLSRKGSLQTNDKNVCSALLGIHSFVVVDVGSERNFVVYVLVYNITLKKEPKYNTDTHTPALLLPLNSSDKVVTNAKTTNSPLKQDTDTNNEQTKTN